MKMVEVRETEIEGLQKRIQKLTSDRDYWQAEAKINCQNSNHWCKKYHGLVIDLYEGGLLKLKMPEVNNDVE